MRRRVCGQSIAEYLIIMAVVAMAIISVAFLPKIQGIFRAYFNYSASRIAS